LAKYKDRDGSDQLFMFMLGDEMKDGNMQTRLVKVGLPRTNLDVQLPVPLPLMGQPSLV
jgi:hypothetical protein